MLLLPMVITFAVLLVAICGLFALWWDAPSTSSPVVAPATNASQAMEVYGRDGMLTSLEASPKTSYGES